MTVTVLQILLNLHKLLLPLLSLLLSSSMASFTTTNRTSHKQKIMAAMPTTQTVIAAIRVPP